MGYVLSVVRELKDMRRPCLSRSSKYRSWYKKRVRRDKKSYAFWKLGGRCACCKQTVTINQVILHHIIPELKTFEFTQRADVSWARFKKELENTEIVCRVCHEELHGRLGIATREQVEHGTYIDDDDWEELMGREC